MKYAPSIFTYAAYAGPKSVSLLTFYYTTNRLKSKEN